MLKFCMKINIILLLLCTSILVSDGRCDDALKKLGRGAANVITCPLELGHQIRIATDEDGLWAGWTVGLVKGLVMMPVRAIVGFYEIVTFPVPAPRNYKPILRDPEFFTNDVVV